MSERTTYAFASRAGVEAALGLLAGARAGILLDKNPAGADGQNLTAIDALLQQIIGWSIDIGINLGLGDGSRKGADRQDGEDGENFHGDFWGRRGFSCEIEGEEGLGVLCLIWNVLSVVKKIKSQTGADGGL